MPSQMVHLAVAYNILKQIDVTKPDMFYLGAISPDAIHMRDGSTRDDKSRVHLRSDDTAVWQENALELIKNNIDKQNYSFYLGYGVHLLTDKIWFTSVFNNGMKAYDADPNIVQDFASAYYNDTDCIDTELYNTLTYRKHIWDLLQNVKPIGIYDYLTADEVDRWNKRTLLWYDKNDKVYNPIKYITHDDINGFIEKCSKDIITIIKANI